LDAAARKRALEHALGTPVPFDVRTLLNEHSPTVGQAPATEHEMNEGGARGQE
jgi:hypothetical protein